ncbi:MAG: lamin tail domain-containing protein [bacterium]
MKKRIMNAGAIFALLLCAGFYLDASQHAGVNSVIVICEIMQNPAAVSDANGEWFELYNSGQEDVDINGWTIMDDGTDGHLIDNGGPLVIPAQGYLVLGRNANQEENGGVPVDYQYSGFTLGNSDDEIILLDRDSVEVDRVEYDGGPEFPDPTGASMELNSPELDNNVGANWHTAFTPYGDGDFGTPGGPNSIPLTITTSELPHGMVGVAYSETLSAVGGVPPYTWQLLSGALPESLSLDVTGVISGTPAVADTQVFTVEVRDAVEGEATQELLLMISALELERGDVDGNGDINILDVLAAVNHILGVQLLEGDALRRADCNGDGEINILDALGIVNVVLGIGECAPV